MTSWSFQTVSGTMTEWEKLHISKFELNDNHAKKTNVRVSS
jgi:hypothetical protein